MIPRFKPALGIKELFAALTPPSTDDIKKFETEFASLMGQKYALAFPYGRTGLMLLLEALGLKNREIVCPAYTCVVVPHSIVYSGNTPVFVDCAKGDFNMDLELAEAAITENTGAIIATSIFGYPVNLDRLDKIREKYPNMLIVQDCAHSFAAEWKGRSVQKEGVAAVFGLNISKLLTSIFGGMITTDDGSLYQKLKQLRDTRLKKPSLKKSLKRFLYLLAVYPAFWEPVYGTINKLEKSGFLDRFSKYYDEALIDMPEDYLEGMTKVEARVGRCNISKYNRIIQKRRKLAQTYCQSLLKLSPSFLLPPQIDGATYSHFTVLVNRREKWMKWGSSHGVQFGSIIDYCIPEMNAYRNKGSYRVSMELSQKALNLPIYKNILKDIENC